MSKIILNIYHINFVLEPEVSLARKDWTAEIFDDFGSLRSYNIISFLCNKQFIQK